MATQDGTKRGGDVALLPMTPATPPPLTGGEPRENAPALRTGTPDATAPRIAVARRRWWPWLGGAIVAAGIGGVLYYHPWIAPKAAVAIETVTLGPLTRVLAVNGTVAALTSVSVRSAVGGRLVALNADAGDKVAVGVVLAQVDATQQQAVVRTAQAALDAGLVAQAQALATFNRTEALGGNVTRNTLEDAARAMQSADQEVGRLSALVDQAKIELTKYAITAPIAGTVLTRGVDPGQLVDTSSALFTLADLSQLIVDTNVDETYATQIATGQPAVLQFVGETRTLTGKVIFVAPQVDVATGGLEVKIGFDTPQAVPVGLTVTANIIVAQKTAAISAPRAAIATDATGSAVFLVGDAVARRQAVTVVDWPADRLEVTKGLAAGDRLILDPTGLKDGQAVTVKGR